MTSTNLFSNPWRKSRMRQDIADKCVYRMSHMDCYKSKWVLWLCFWCQTLFPSDLCWKCVYILIFGISFFRIFHPMIWVIFHFFRKIKNWKNAPNHRGTLWKIKKKLFQKSKCAHISSKNLKDPKNIVIALIYVFNNPWGTPCRISHFD